MVCLMKIKMMFACSKTPAPNFREDLKISDQNNWGGPEQNIKFDGGGGCGGAKFKVGPKIKIL